MIFIILICLLIPTTVTATSHVCITNTQYVDLDKVCELPVQINMDEIREKVIPTIVYARIKYDINGFYKGDIVEIIEDVGHGKHYRVKRDDFSTWVPRYAFEFIETHESSPPHLEPVELELFVNHSGFESKTDYFVWVDLARQMVYVFVGEKENWSINRLLICSTGKQETSTIRGTFSIQNRDLELHSTEYARYWVKFYDDYLFHSTPLDIDGNVVDPTLGSPASGGCIRLQLEDALWFYETIPDNTTVWVN